MLDAEYWSGLLASEKEKSSVQELYLDTVSVSLACAVVVVEESEDPRCDDECLHQSAPLRIPSD